MTNGNLILVYLICTPVVSLISFGLCMFLYNRDAELIIKNGFKKAIKEVYKENRDE